MKSFVLVLTFLLILSCKDEKKEARTSFYKSVRLVNNSKGKFCAFNEYIELDSLFSNMDKIDLAIDNLKMSTYGRNILKCNSLANKTHYNLFLYNNGDYTAAGNNWIAHVKLNGYRIKSVDYNDDLDRVDLRELLDSLEHLNWNLCDVYKELTYVEDKYLKGLEENNKLNEYDDYKLLNLKTRFLKGIFLEANSDIVKLISNKGYEYCDSYAAAQID